MLHCSPNRTHLTNTLFSRMTNSRRKNKHPKRAENVKTVVVTKTSGGVREEEGEGDEDVERLRRMLTCVPCGVEQNHRDEERRNWCYYC